MNVQNIEKKEHNIVTFQVKVDAAAFDAEVNKVYLKNKSQLYVAGFRKGKAPRQVIEGMYGSQIFYEEAIENCADSAFVFGVQENDFECVGKPSIVDVKVTEEKEVVYTFQTALYPEVKLGQYRGLEVPMDHSAFDEARVDEEMQNVRKRNARLIDVERPVQMGDQIVLDFDGYVDGEQFEGGKAEDYDLEIGSNTFIPGFEEQLIGAEIGEEREINVTFPEEYVEHLAGKPAVFKVKIKSVKEPELPELDDELAKDISDFDTMAEYIDHVREDLKKKHEMEQESSYAGRLMQAAIDNLEVDIPEPMIEEKLDEQLRNYGMSMGMGNVSKEQMLEAMQVDEQTFQTMMRPQATFEIMTDLLLDTIIKEENIELEESEIEKTYADMAKEYGMEAEKLKDYINEDIMRQDLKRRKAAAIIRDTAVDKEPEPAEETAEEAPAAEETAE